MADRKLLIDAELHAHAQQLLGFSEKHDVGFVVMLIEKDKSFRVVTNLSPAQKRAVAESWLDQLYQPVTQSFHGAAIKV